MSIATDTNAKGLLFEQNFFRRMLAFWCTFDHFATEASKNQLSCIMLLLLSGTAEGPRVTDQRLSGSPFPLTLEEPY